MKFSAIVALLLSATGDAKGDSPDQKPVEVPIKEGWHSGQLLHPETCLCVLKSIASSKKLELGNCDEAFKRGYFGTVVTTHRSQDLTSHSLKNKQQKWYVDSDLAMTTNASGSAIAVIQNWYHSEWDDVDEKTGKGCGNGQQGHADYVELVDISGQNVMVEDGATLVLADAAPDPDAEEGYDWAMSGLGMPNLDKRFQFAFVDLNFGHTKQHVCNSHPAFLPDEYSPAPAPQKGGGEYKTVVIEEEGSPTVCLSMPEPPCEGCEWTRGNKVGLSECTGTDAQTWYFDDQNMIRYGDSSLCIDALPDCEGCKAEGKLWLWDCNGMDNQAWGYDDGKVLNVKSSEFLCLHLDKDGDVSSRRPSHCTSSGTETWSIQDAPAPSGPVPPLLV